MLHASAAFPSHWVLILEAAIVIAGLVLAASWQRRARSGRPRDPPRAVRDGAAPGALDRGDRARLGPLPRHPHRGLGSAAAARRRRVELPARGRHLRAQPADQSAASDGRVLRRRPRPAAADLRVEVPAGAGTHARDRTGGVRSPGDRAVARGGAAGRRGRLDAAGVGAPAVGRVRRTAGRASSRRRQLLERELLGRLGGGDRRRPGSRRRAPVVAPCALRRRRHARPRPRAARHQPALRGHAGGGAGRPAPGGGTR